MKDDSKYVCHISNTWWIFFWKVQVLNRLLWHFVKVDCASNCIWCCSDVVVIHMCSITLAEIKEVIQNMSQLQFVMDIFGEWKVQHLNMLLYSMTLYIKVDYASSCFWCVSDAVTHSHSIYSQQTSFNRSNKEVDLSHCQIWKQHFQEHSFLASHKAQALPTAICLSSCLHSAKFCNLCIWWTYILSRE